MSNAVPTTCPICLAEGTVKTRTTHEDVEVRGERFAVIGTEYVCSNCENAFFSEDGQDTFELGKRAYREKYGMVQPEALVNWRTKLKMSQEEVAAILGWGASTVSRYENGKLQEPAHDKELQLAMLNSENLLKLVNDSQVLSRERRAELAKKLNAEIDASYASWGVYTRKAKPAPGEKTNFTKVKQLIALLCGKEGEFETKLNKLLFYVDFKSYKVRHKTVSGLSYTRMQFGPVPSFYGTLYDLLEEQGAIAREEACIGNRVGTIVKATMDADKNTFPDDELLLILEIKNRFLNFSATEISDFSHREPAWLRTDRMEVISYSFAENLQV